MKRIMIALLLAALVLIIAVPAFAAPAPPIPDPACIGLIEAEDNGAPLPSFVEPDPLHECPVRGF